MPTIDDNKQKWDGSYSWQDRGDEWSRPWGSVAAQWYGTLLPRVHHAVPAGHILEIACGYGRWTEYLKDLGARLTLVDLSAECIDACRRRFADARHIDYHVTDGKSLDMVDDRSVDFVFSFDSLVHVDMGVLRAYISQMARVLTPEGVAFLHHSNLGEAQAKYTAIRKVPKLEGLLSLAGYCEFLHWRDPGVTAGAVARVAEEHGLRCVTQEIVHWQTRRDMIDCMSTIVRQGSARDRAPQVLRNSSFMEEAAIARRLAPLYSSGGRQR